jgi:hypothetical protein
LDFSFGYFSDLAFIHNPLQKLFLVSFTGSFYFPRNFYFSHFSRLAFLAGISGQKREKDASGAL